MNNKKMLSSWAIVAVGFTLTMFAGGCSNDANGTSPGKGKIDPKAVASLAGNPNLKPTAEQQAKIDSDKQRIIALSMAANNARPTHIGPPAR